MDIATTIVQAFTANVTLIVLRFLPATPVVTLEVTMQTGSVTTTRTTAVHTALMDNATPVGPIVIPLRSATMWADCIVTVIAIMKRPDAALRSTETARASGIVRPTIRPVHVPILADTTTSDFGDATTIPAPVHTAA